MLDVLLKKALAENNMELTADIQQKLIAYLNLIEKWNRIYNLTSILDPREMVYLHLIDSLMIAPYLKGTHFLDVGSGAGLPGIPLAIVHPDQHWVLLDKNSKKTRFLTQVAAELKLKNVDVVHSRSEDFHPEAGFDSIISRALGTLTMFVETTHHLRADHGIFIAMKGKYPEEELQELPTHYAVQTILPLHMKGMSLERHLVCLK